MEASSQRRAENKLRAVLDERHLSQNQLSKRLGVEPGAISAICRGKRQPRIALALAIAQEVGEPVDRIFYLPPSSGQATNGTHHAA